MYMFSFVLLILAVDMYYAVGLESLILLTIPVVCLLCSLFVEKLPRHPGYAKAPATDKARVKKLLNSSFERAMELKDKLKKQYEGDKRAREKEIKIAKVRCTYVP